MHCLVLTMDDLRLLEEILGSQHALLLTLTTKHWWKALYSNIHGHFSHSELTEILADKNYYLAILER